LLSISEYTASSCCWKGVFSRSLNRIGGGQIQVKRANPKIGGSLLDLVGWLLAGTAFFMNNAADSAILE